MLRLKTSSQALALLFLATHVVIAADPPTMTHGPMLGMPSATTMKIWARTSEATKFSVRYGIRQDLLSEVVVSESTLADHDFTGTVILRQLQPDTRYWYQVFVADWPQGGVN